MRFEPWSGTLIVLELTSAQYLDNRRETTMLLGDAATAHAESAKARATRRMIRALAKHEAMPRIARHFATALEEGITERALNAATDRAIVRRLEQILWTR